VASLTRYDAREGNAGDPLKGEAVAVVARHSQEKGLVGRNELGDVPEAERLALGVVADRQGLDHPARYRQELDPVGPSGRRQSGGFQEDVCGDTWKDHVASLCALRKVYAIQKVYKCP